MLFAFPISRFSVFPMTRWPDGAMARFLRLLCVSVSLCWVLAAQQQPVQNPQVANAGKAKDIVQRAIVALGGDFYTKIFDMKQTGRGFGFYHNEATGVGVPFTRLYQYPDKDRFEYFKSGEWVVIFANGEGYETTFRGSRLVDPQDKADYNRRNKYALDRVLREWVSDPKTAFFYEGTTLIGPKQVHQITLLSKDNLSETLFIDTKTYLPVQKQYSWRDPETRQMQEEAELYDEYRPIQNVQTPFKITRMKNGEISSQRFLKNVAYNVGVGDLPFTPPVLQFDKRKK
jgi:hypothetical protein